MIRVPMNRNCMIKRTIKEKKRFVCSSTTLHSLLVRSEEAHCRKPDAKMFELCYDGWASRIISYVYRQTLRRT